MKPHYDRASVERTVRSFLDDEMKQLKKGDKIRLKVPTISGWKGKATVVETYPGGLVEFLKDGDELDEYGRSYNYICRHEVAVMRATSNAVLSGKPPRTEL